VDSIRNCASVGHIEDIAVAADQQGKKLGLRIIQALDSIAQHVGCYKSILDCSEKNQGFYEKCGFKLAGVQMVRRYRRGRSCFDFLILASGTDFDRRTTMKTNKLFRSGVWKCSLVTLSSGLFHITHGGSGFGTVCFCNRGLESPRISCRGLGRVL